MGTISVMNTGAKPSNCQLAFRSNYINKNNVKLKSFKNMNNTEENQKISKMETEVKNQRPDAEELFRKAINESGEEGSFSVNKEARLWMKKANETMKEAAKLKDRVALYKKLWYEGEISVLFAMSNLGKSILAVQIAEEIARSGKEVNYLDYELEGKQFQQRYCNERTKKNYVFSENFLRADLSYDLELDSNGRLARFFEQIEELSKLGVKIFILDNITSLVDKIENGDVILEFMRKLKRLKEKYGLSILIVAHTTKKKDTAPLTQDSLAGSKKLMNFVDSAFAIGKSLIETSVRYIKQLKVRTGKYVYDESNVLLCQIEKRDNFPHFVECGYAVEKDLLNTKKSIANADKREAMDVAYASFKQGDSLRAIGRKLGVSDKTIKKWIEQIEAHKVYALAAQSNV